MRKNKRLFKPSVIFMLFRSLFVACCFLCYCIPVLAQNITNVGNDATFEIATWNIEWFGDSNNGPSNDALQVQNAAAVIAGSGIELWGVQEIADDNEFDDLLAALGDDYDGQLATNSVQQRIGFVYDTRVVQVRQIRHILEDFMFEFASRPPLQLEADIMLPDTTVTMTFIVLHMKAFSDQSSYERRVDASTRLKNNIDFTALDSKRVIVLGDFNDELLRSTYANQTSPYKNFIDDDANYFFPSLALEQSGEGSFCSNSSCSSTGSMLDHLLITNELFDVYIPSSAGFIPDLPTAINSFGNTTSDHLPVYARFDFSRISGTSVEQDRPDAYFTIDAPFPNPSRQTANIPFKLDRASQVTIQLYDLLGRLVLHQAHGQRPPGSYEESIDVTALPAGTYFVRVSINGQSQSLPLIKAD